MNRQKPHKDRHQPTEKLITNTNRKKVKCHFRLRQRRIKFLARPKQITPKYCPTYYSFGSDRKTKIIRDIPCMRRTEQLAHPYVRKLLPIQREFGKLFHPQRRYILNRTIRKSMLSLYSRLANVQAPKEKKYINGWNKKDWEMHRKYLTKLARPKRVIKPQKSAHAWMDIKLMKRYKRLSKPKDRREITAPQWKLTQAMRSYKPSSRTILLSAPKQRGEYIHNQSLPLRVSPTALRYEPSERIKQLATIPEQRLVESDVKTKSLVISPNALKAKPSERVKELSKPKEYLESHTRENAFVISPAALKAKPTPRILELSKPKGSA